MNRSSTASCGSTRLTRDPRHGERVGVFFTTSTYVWANSVVFTTESNLAPCWQCNVVVGLLDRTFGGHSDIRRDF